MTFKKWVLCETEQFVVSEGKRLLEEDDIVRFVYDCILATGSLQVEQKRLSTVQAIVTEIMLMRENGLSVDIVNESMRPLFEQLLTEYDSYLTDKQAVDYTSLLRYLLEKELNVTADVIFDNQAHLTNLEKEIVSLYEIDVTNDEVYFIYTHADLLQTIYDKLKKQQIPATFASGVSINWTEAYFFKTMVQYIG